MKSKGLLSTLSILTVLAGCENEPVTIGMNTQELEIDQVDILLVVDDSASMQGLQTQLPELLDSFIAGSDEPGHERPELTDIHVAVVSTDMGVGTPLDPSAIEGCVGSGDDGVFIELTSEDIAQCSPDTGNFVEYEDGHAQITTELAASCVPDVGTGGCGFEQPLEAMLKALWPASNTDIRFMTGDGHGEDTNAGFLREGSLLVVIVVSDEDDCSARDPFLFDPMGAAANERGLNTICATSDDELFDVDRYVDGLRALREAENDPILFVALSGVPVELAEAQGEVDLSDSEAVDAYYTDVLDAPEMQIAIDPRGTEDFADDNLVPSCTKVLGDEGFQPAAFPPRRLVQVAQAFGSAGVLGSICGEDFASTIGGVIRATAERL